MATLKSIAYKPVGVKEDHSAHGYLRHMISKAQLIAGYGIENDRKGGHPKRNLNVMDDLTLAELGAEGYPTQPGALGENLIVSGIDLRTLPAGTQLRIGSEAIVELLKLREPCEQLTPIDERMPASVVGRVGVMCRVLRGGPIQVGDEVEVAQERIEQQA